MYQALFNQWRELIIYSSQQSYQVDTITIALLLLLLHGITITMLQIREWDPETFLELSKSQMAASDRARVAGSLDAESDS